MTSKRGLTYEDLKRMFNKEDLHKYNELCLRFGKWTAGKNNMQLWQELVESDAPSDLRQTPKEIHEIRGKYDLNPESGESFFYVWSAAWREDGSYIYQVVSW